MDPHVHLVQTLLHTAQPVGTLRFQPALIAYEGTQHSDLLAGPEGAAQQPATMEPLNPLTIQPVRLTATRHARQRSGVDQQYFQSVPLQNFMRCDPVNACTFHRHRLYLPFLQPRRQPLQFRRSGAKALLLASFAFQRRSARPMRCAPQI